MCNFKASIVTDTLITVERWPNNKASKEMIFKIVDIEIDFSNVDVEDLKSGESINWTFTENKYASLEINVRIYNSESQ